MEKTIIYLIVLLPILFLIILEILWTVLKNAIKRGVEQGICNAYHKLKNEKEIDYILHTIYKFKKENVDIQKSTQNTETNV